MFMAFRNITNPQKKLKDLLASMRLISGQSKRLFTTLLTLTTHSDAASTYMDADSDICSLSEYTELFRYLGVESFSRTLALSPLRLFCWDSVDMSSAESKTACTSACISSLVGSLGVPLSHSSCWGCPAMSSGLTGTSKISLLDISCPSWPCGNGGKCKCSVCAPSLEGQWLSPSTPVKVSEVAWPFRNRSCSWRSIHSQIKRWRATWCSFNAASYAQLSNVESFGPPCPSHLPGSKTAAPTSQRAGVTASFMWE
mmetsp:Transcript_119002/g.237238  ORF Transcript_119002/g.237238 Transcript_119002/m.237238 type:complete len:255 (-) Transcript_119002:76-840(-)